MRTSRTSRGAGWSSPGARGGSDSPSRPTSAARGADVTITGTDAGRAAEVAAQIEHGARAGTVTGRGLDLADLDAVAAFAAGLGDRVDCLIANAGIMRGPYATTGLGVERQLAVNFLGHFALVGHLLPALAASGAARVVSVSSTYHRVGRLDRASLEVTRQAYRPHRAYGTSKLAMLVFARELARRAGRHGLPITSVAAHPGWANTELQARQMPRPARALMRAANAVLAAPVEVGAEPILCAATLPSLPSGVFIGPVPTSRRRRVPGIATAAPSADDPAAPARLWGWAADRTGVAYLGD